MNVAWAGFTTSVRAVLSTLLEIAATGSATMKIPAPITVATNQQGRAMTASAAAASKLKATSAACEVLVVERTRARHDPTIPVVSFMFRRCDARKAQVDT